MTLQEILALRPTGTDVESVKAAIARAAAARETVLKLAGTLDQRAAQALLSAEDDELLALEQQARAAHLSADRIASLMPELEAMLPVAQRQAHLGAINASIAQYKASSAAFCKAWRADYAKAAAVIIGLMELAEKVKADREAVHVRTTIARDSGLDWAGGALPDIPPDPVGEMFAGLGLHSDAGQLPFYPPAWVQIPPAYADRRAASWPRKYDAFYGTELQK
jgi:hypothetical protein